MKPERLHFFRSYKAQLGSEAIDELCDEIESLEAACREKDERIQDLCEYGRSSERIAKRLGWALDDCGFWHNPGCSNPANFEMCSCLGGQPPSAITLEERIAELEATIERLRKCEGEVLGPVIAEWKEEN